MRFRLALAFVTTLFLSSIAMPQEAGTNTPSDVAFWVAHWAQPAVILFGPEEEAFYKNMKNVMFSRNIYDDPVNPSALDDDVQWLKDHPGVRFYLGGYSSITGDVVYNLLLAQKRADWVKQVLVSRGIAQDRIVFAVGWGELYPVCAEDTQECWDRNKLVRFVYSPS
jgi:outer membrane protein OmpA-like peptidoglycan-associated protein